MPHQAGIHANQFKLIQPGLSADYFQRGINLVQVKLIADCRGKRQPGITPTGCGRVAPAAGPAHAVV